MATLQEGDKEMPEGGMSIEEIELEKQLLKVHYYNHVMSHNIYLFYLFIQHLYSALFTNRYALMRYNISAEVCPHIEIASNLLLYFAINLL